MNEEKRKRPNLEDSTCFTTELCNGKPSSAISYYDERYHLDKHIGNGGFSNCYSYKSRSGKKLLAKISFHFDAQRRFENDIQIRRKSWLNEVKILSMLKHTNIVQYYASIETKNLRYILMDLCVTDLHKVHQIEPHMPISKVRHIMIDLLNGLKFIHQKNIVHRDIKLSNLLLTADNRVKICDFGVAMILSHRVKMISNREICGTINYLAPEMVGAKSRFELTTAADIWSAGCVMFILLNGLLPFKASKKSYVYTRIRHRIFPVSDHVKQQPGGYAAMSICKDIFNSSHKTRPTASDLLHRRFFSDNNALRTLDWVEDSPAYTSLHRMEYWVRKLDRVCSAQRLPKSTDSTQLNDLQPCWLISYINYTNDDGLPFVLSNGKAGIFFNDRTTLLFERNGGADNGFQYLIGSQGLEPDRTSADYKKKKNLLIIFYTELKQLADKSGHQQMCNPSHRNVTVIGYYRKPKLLIVVFSNNTMQINTVYERSTRPIEILIGYDYVQVFNGTKYLSFTYSEVPAEVVDLIERAKDNFENDVNEDD